MQGHHARSLWASRYTTPQQKVPATDRWALDTLQAGLGGAPVRLTLWDGRSNYPPSPTVIAVVRIVDRGALWRMLWHREVGFGEGFRAGRITVDGDLAGGLEAVFRAAKVQPATRYRPWRGWSSRLSNTIERARVDVRRVAVGVGGFYPIDTVFRLTNAIIPSR